MDFQATDNWRVTGRYMNNKERHPAGLRHDVGRQRQRPAPDADAVHPPRLELHAVGDRHPQPDDVARSELGPRLELAQLRAAAGRCSGRRPPARRLPLLFPGRGPGRLRPLVQFRGGRTGNAGQYQTDRGPFTNENITHDVVANLTKVWGSHASKAGFYYQNSFKPQSIFASFNGQIDFTDDAQQPVRHRLQLRERGDGRLQHLHAGLEVRHPGMALQEHRVLRAGQLEAPASG